MRSPFALGAKQMKDISLRIQDMECAACVARLDRALEKLPGVQRAAVNYTAASALITYDERVTDLAAIAARVKRAGFRVPVEEQDLLPAEADAETAAAAADAQRAVFGVKGVAVQADGTLTAYLWPIGVDGRDLAADCAATPGELRGGDADQKLEKRMDLLKTLVTSACCTAPLMLEMHPKLQFLAGTALQFGPGAVFSVTGRISAPCARCSIFSPWRPRPAAAAAARRGPTAGRSGCSADRRCTYACPPSAARPSGSRRRGSCPRTGRSGCSAGRRSA